MYIKILIWNVIFGLNKLKTSMADYKFVEGNGFVPIKLVQTVLDDSKLTILDKSISLYQPPGNLTIPESIIIGVNEFEKAFTVKNDGEGNVTINSIRANVPDTTIRYNPKKLPPGQLASVSMSFDSTQVLDGNRSAIIEYNLSTNKFTNSLITKLDIEPGGDLSTIGIYKFQNKIVSTTKFENGGLYGYPEVDLEITLKILQIDYKGSNNADVSMMISVPSEFVDSRFVNSSNEPFTNSKLLVRSLENGMYYSQITLKKSDTEKYALVYFSHRRTWQGAQQDLRFNITYSDNSRKQPETIFLSFIPGLQTA